MRVLEWPRSTNTSSMGTPASSQVGGEGVAEPVAMCLLHLGGLEHAGQVPGPVRCRRTEVLPAPEEILPVALDLLERLDDDLRQRNVDRLSGLLRVQLQLLPADRARLSAIAWPLRRPEYRISRTKAFIRDLSPRYRSQAAKMRAISAAVNGSVGLAVSLGALSVSAAFSLTHFMRWQNRKNDRSRSMFFGHRAGCRPTCGGSRPMSPA